MDRPNKTKPKDGRKRIELCDWNETLHVTAKKIKQARRVRCPRCGHEFLVA